MTKFNEWWQTKSADFHEDADAWSVGQGWRAREPEIESLRQQLAESQAREKVLRDALVRASGYEAYMEDKIITNALTLPSDSTALDLALRQAEESTKQAMIADGWRQCAKGQRTTQYCGLTEEAIRQAKREALLEAINEWEKPYGLTDGSPFIERLRRMADNLKD